MSLFSILENRRLLDELDDIMYDIHSIRHVEAEVSRHAQYRNAERGFAQLEEAIDTNNRGLVDFFEEIEEKMPSGMLLLSAVCTNEGVTLSIRVTSLEAAARVITEFYTFESVEALEVSAISVGQDEAGFPFYTFTVSCLYEKPVVPERQSARSAEAGTDESEEE
jgi:hypothetical protein